MTAKSIRLSTTKKIPHKTPHKKTPKPVSEKQNYSDDEKGKKFYIFKKSHTENHFALQFCLTLYSNI